MSDTRHTSPWDIPCGPQAHLRWTLTTSFIRTAITVTSKLGRGAMRVRVCQRVVTFTLGLLAACAPAGSWNDWEPPEIPATPEDTSHDDSDDVIDDEPLGDDEDGPRVVLEDLAVFMFEEDHFFGHVIHVLPMLARDEDLHTVFVDLENTGDAPADVTVTVDVPKFATPARVQQRVKPGARVTVELSPNFDLRAVYELRSTVTTPLTVSVEVDGLAGKRVAQRNVDLTPPTRVPWSSSEGDDLRPFAITLVTPDDPAVADIITEARDWTMDGNLAGYLPGNDVYDEIAAVYYAIWSLGVGYSNIPGSFFDDTQRVRLASEALQERGANCIDGALLFASVYEQLGMQPAVVFLTGHAVVGVWDANPYVDPEAVFYIIETTMVGSDYLEFEDAISSGYDTFMDAYENDPQFLAVDVLDMRHLGVTPIPF